MSKPGTTVFSTFIFIVLFQSFLGDNVLGHEAYADPRTKGGPGDNPNTLFDGGCGPGACSVEGMPNYWVNTATRKLVVQDTDFSYAGLGPKIRILRTYNMPRWEDTILSGMFGNRWSFAYESSIDQSGQSKSPKFVSFNNGSGQGIQYLIDLSVTPPVAATPPAGTYARLTWHGNYWLFYQKETRLTYRYDRVAGSNVSRLTSIADRNGNAVTINYNSDGTIKEISDAASRRISFTYNASKLCTSMTTPDGRSTAYEYDTSGNLIKTTDMLGSVTSYAYAPQYYMTAITVGDRMTRFTLTDTGFVASVIDARGNVTTYDTDFYGVTEVTDPEGGSVRYGVSGGEGYTMGVRDSLDNVTGFSYDFAKSLLPTRVSWYNMSQTYNKWVGFTHNSDGNLTETAWRVELDGGDDLWPKTSFTYDAAGNLLTTTDALGNTWTYTHDDKGRLTKIRSPMGKETILTYDSKGQLNSFSNPDGSQTQFGYDTFGNVTSSFDPLGNTTRISYDSLGMKKTSVTDARSNTTRFEYDNNDRLTKMIHPDGTFKTYTYDCCALTSITDENGHTTSFTRDPMLYITEVTGPLGEKIQQRYNKNSKMVSSVDELGNTTARNFDAANRLTALTHPKGDTVQLGYDSVGNVISVTNGKGKQTTLTYSDGHRVLSATDPLGRKVTFKRDVLDRIATMTNARGGKVAFTYDADGHITGYSYDGVVAATYSFDAGGNLTGVNDSTGTTTLAYTNRQELRSIRYFDGKLLSFTYDAAGNVSSIQYPGGFTVDYTYDVRNRLSRAAWQGNSIEYTYDGAGNTTQTVRSNGTKDSFEYDANNNVTAIRYENGGTAFGNIAYIRNAGGGIKQESRTLPVSARVAPKSTNAVYNDADQIVTWGPDSYTYDADGNLTRITGGRTFTAAYDPENRPVSMSRNGVTAAYTYDGIGNRTKVAGGSSTVTYYHDFDGRVLFEADGGGNILVYYIYSGGRLAARKDSAGSGFYHFDGAGNTVAITDGGGDVVAAYAYEPFGMISKSSGSISNPFTYGGAFGVMDEGDGLYYMKNRYYDGRTGRFIQKDPIGIQGGINPYTYVGNDPLNRVDPTGTADQIMSGTYDINSNTLPVNMKDSTASKFEQKVFGTAMVAIIGAMVISLAWPAVAGAGAAGTEAAVAETAAATCPQFTHGMFIKTLYENQVAFQGVKNILQLNRIAASPAGRTFLGGVYKEMVGLANVPKFMAKFTNQQHRAFTYTTELVGSLLRGPKLPFF